MNEIIVHAAKNSDYELVKRELELNPKLNLFDTMGWAVYNEDPKMVELLLKDPRINPSYFFFRCVALGNKELTKLFYQDPRTDVSCMYNSALTVAVSSGRINYAKNILNHSTFDTTHCTQPIKEAILRNSEDLVQLLIDNLAYDIDLTGWVLNWAVFYDYEEVILTTLSNYYKNALMAIACMDWSSPYPTKFKRLPDSVVMEYFSPCNYISRKYITKAFHKAVRELEDKFI